MSDARLQEIRNAALNAEKLGLSDHDVRLLEDAAKTDPFLRKVLVVRYFAMRQFAEALPHAKVIFEAEENAENGRNYFLVLCRLGKLEEAEAVRNSHPGLISEIDTLDAFCAAAFAAKNTDQAIDFGTRALRAKDEAAVRGFDGKPPKLPRIKTAGPNRYLSFSLFGEEERYLRGAITNAIAARYVYPGWKVRFYVDDTVPETAITTLIREGAEVAKVGGSSSIPARLMWRFLIEDDDSVDVYQVRDADAVVNVKERLAVEDWLASGRPFHVMRDHPTQSELILAGMWGAHSGHLGSMKDRIQTYLSNRPRALNDRTADQLFLRSEIWPLIKHNSLVHDSHFRFGRPKPYRSELELPEGRFLGQNDAIFWRSKSQRKGGG